MRGIILTILAIRLIMKQNYRSYNYWVAILSIHIAVAALGDDVTTISGSLGNWRITRQGVGNLNGAGRALPGPAATVARALDAARDLDVAAFGDCIASGADGKKPSEVKAWYEEWRLCSRQYIYVINDEAVLVTEGQNGKNLLAAISIAPSAPVLPKRQFSDTPSLRAQVIFARQVGTAWKLIWEVPDTRIAEFLLTKATPMVYRPMPNVYRSEEEAKEALRTQDQKEQTGIIQRRKAQGASVGELNGLKEKFARQNAGNPVKTWEDWKKAYSAEILSPPVRFDTHEQCPIDFSTPIAALRSFHRAFVMGDAPTLLDHVDESGRTWLTRSGVDVGNRKSSYDLFPKMSRITVLLTAVNQFEGTDYTLVLYRVEESSNPKTGRVTLQTRIFRRSGNHYLVSDDFSGTSPFGGVRIVAGAEKAFMSAYPDFYEKARQSSFPSHFYTIE